MSSVIQLIKLIHRYRYTIWIMALKEIRAKYVGSALGIGWNIIHPIISIFVFWIVFSLGFKVPPPNNIPFLSWFFCAFVVWLVFNDSLLSASNSIIRNRNLIKKLVFPAHILPLISIFSSLINSIILIMLLIIVLLIEGVPLSLYSLQFIYYLFSCAFLCLGIGWFFAAASILLKDIGQFLTIILQILFWATPIFYNLEMFPANVRIYWKLNPVYYLTEGFRDSFLFNQPFWNDPSLTLYFWSITISTFILGGIFFKKFKADLVDNL